MKSQRSLGRPKTPRSRRAIPLTQLAVDPLREHHVAQTVERLMHGGEWNPEKLVFCATTSAIYSVTNWHNQQYRPLLQNASLPYVRPPRPPAYGRHVAAA